ncbi:hypothetical protein [Solidesulfovibrio sp. C21]|uniref:hypothetical protein n=1 Tax=Solidesulfovibrio sp. C21 TaxID=3398613 RepID=UPI0039FC0E7C
MLHPLLSPRRVLFAAILCTLAFFAAPSSAPAQQVNPYGNCCVAQVTMDNDSANTWTVICGSCATNPGRYTVTQPDPAKLIFLGPNGVSAGSPYDAAVAICRCPSQNTRRAWEKKMRTFEGN